MSPSQGTPSPKAQSRRTEHYIVSQKPAAQGVRYGGSADRAAAPAHGRRQPGRAKLRPADPCAVPVYVKNCSSAHRSRDCDKSRCHCEADLGCRGNPPDREKTCNSQYFVSKSFGDCHGGLCPPRNDTLYSCVVKLQFIVKTGCAHAHPVDFYFATKPTFL